MRILSPRSGRSTRAVSRKKKTIVSAGGHTLPDRSVTYPNIYVEVGRNPYGRMEFAKCQIKLKRKLYRYLVWKHNGEQFAFYMGKVKILTPLPRRPAAAPASSQASGSRSERGARK